VHAAHENDPADEKVPGLQAEHWTALDAERTDDHVPALQFEQLAEPKLAQVPTPHNRQAEEETAPRREEAVPATQERQVDEPASE
jgi:hypothetical protein